MAPPLRVLVVEDEPIVAMALEDLLDDVGLVRTGTAATLADALALAEAGGFDLALLDVNLSGERSLPVADLLRDRGVPYVFTTGYGRAGIPPAHAAAPLVEKPYTAAGLLRAIDAAGGAGGHET